MSTELTGALIALLVPVCFGSGTVFARIGLVHIPANSGNFISLVSGWLVIAVVAAIFFPGALFGVSLVTLGWLAMIGTINFPIGRLMNFTSIRKLGVLRANPVLALSPIVSAFEGVVFLGEEINAAIGLGTLVAVAGVIIVVAGEGRARSIPQPATRPAPAGAAPADGFFASRPRLVGYLAAIAGALAYGSVPALGRVAVTELTIPLVTAVYTMAFGALVMGLFVAHRFPADLRQAPRNATLWVVAGGVSMSAGVTFLYMALSRAPVVVVSPVFSLNAFVALVLAHFMLQRLERITPQIMLGTVLVVGGVVGVIVGSQF